MTGRTIHQANRAVSREGFAAIAFGMTVVMIAATGGLLMQTSGGLADNGPMLTAEADPVGADEQWVSVKHRNGRAVAVSDLRVNVTLPDHRKRASLHGLPTDELRQSDYDGNHVFHLGTGGVAGAATAANRDGRWAAGERLAVRLSDRRVDLQPGQTVEIEVYHTGEEQTVFSETVTVT